MRAGPWLLRILGTLLLCCNAFCAGCSALIAYSGENVGKLANREQVRESLGTPCKSRDDNGHRFDEYHTRRKIAEPNVAGVNFILGVESLGVLELWMFPSTLCQWTWTTLAGQDLRFEYGTNGEVERVLIDGMPMESRASLP
jgi:hypothetical protein